jgi:ubiquinone/menaquinone biosynthesis C-methylase UbiE
MNEEELKANKEVGEYVVRDLNLEPALPFPDDSFDIVTNAVSVDYLNKPLEVFQEIHRWVLGGLCLGLEGLGCWGFGVLCAPGRC